MADFTNTVEQVKAELASRGVSLGGPCGAFEITARVAWLLRMDGWGYMAAPIGGDNCHGVRTDKLVTKDGRFVDLLVDAGGANTPAWQERPATPDEIAAWRPPLDPGDVAVPVPAPAPPPAPPPPFDLQAFAAELFNELEQIARRVADLTTAVQALTTKLDTVNQQGVRIHF